MFKVTEFRGHDGLRLLAETVQQGDATSIVLLHGGGQTRHSWREAAVRLAANGYSVVNLDARGHGDSDWSSEGRYDFDVFAEDLRAVVATIRTKLVLVGASMGGATALFLAGSASPPTISGLVLVDIVPRVEQQGADRVIAFMQSRPDGFATVDEAAKAVAAYLPHRNSPPENDSLLKHLRRRSDGRLYWHWDPRLLLSTFALEAKGFYEPLTQAARNVGVPTLLIRGLHSDIVSDAGVADLKIALPHLEVVNVADATHMVAGDKNDAFNDALLSFLNKHLPSPP